MKNWFSLLEVRGPLLWGIINGMTATGQLALCCCSLPDQSIISTRVNGNYIMTTTSTIMPPFLFFDIGLIAPHQITALKLHPGPSRASIDQERSSITHHHTPGASSHRISSAQRGMLASGWMPRPTTLSGRMPAIV